PFLFTSYSADTTGNKRGERNTFLAVTTTSVPLKNPPFIPALLTFKNYGYFPIFTQGRTDNSWGNRGSWGPCVLAQTQKSL
ncbi:unnamed protein product, partial [Staurois parvus]